MFVLYAGKNEFHLDDKFDLQSRLFRLICEQCRCENGITEISNIEDMLATACGMQYDIEET